VKNIQRTNHAVGNMKMMAAIIDGGARRMEGSILEPMTSTFDDTIKDVGR
jgi:hypothetical protein